MALIELREIFQIYGTDNQPVYVLRDINLTVETGEFVSIMGPSGSGKSTLLHLLGMLERPVRGEYLFDGQPVHELKDRQISELSARNIGFVFQQYHLIDELTVYENLETPLLYRKLGRKDRESLVCDMLDRFQIVGKKDLFPNQLSGGQQRLVGIARALIIEPKLILADEPTGNLHSDQGREIMELFAKLNRQGVTIIQVTHSEANAGYGQRIVELLDGRVVRKG
jgi:ABC-type lipoprotein export system ATPase subunit